MLVFMLNFFQKEIVGPAQFRNRIDGSILFPHCVDQELLTQSDELE